MAEKEKSKAKATELQSPEARAWNETKVEGDPEWDQIPEIEFKQKLDFAASRVRAVGLGAAPTNFEKRLYEILQDESDQSNEGAMARTGGSGIPTSAPTDATPPAQKAANAKAAAKSSSSSKSSSSKSKSKAKPKSAAAKAKAKNDTSGHVATGKEAAAAAREQKTSPIHP